MVYEWVVRYMADILIVAMTQLDKVYLTLSRITAQFKFIIYLASKYSHIELNVNVSYIISNKLHFIEYIFSLHVFFTFKLIKL